MSRQSLLTNVLYSKTAMAKPRKTTKPAKKATPSKAKKVTTEKKQSRKTPSQETFYQNIYRRLKLDESYMSLFLGVVVVVTLCALLFILMLGKSAMNNTQTRLPANITPVANKQTERTYILKDGEGLWDVAVKFYGDGYKWTIISDANHLADNPDAVYPGMKLIIPPLK